MHGYGNFAIVPVSDTKPNPWHLENLPSSIGPTELKALISLRSISSLLSFSASASVRRSISSHFSFFLLPCPLGTHHISNVSRTYPSCIRIFFFKYFFLFSLILSRYRQLYRHPNSIRIGLDEVPLPAIDRHSFFLAFVDCRRWSSSAPFLTICLADSHSLSLALPLFWIGIANRNFFSFFVFLLTCSVAWALALLPLGP